MAEATMHDGRAIVAYRNGKAIDSEGVVIEGAPKPPKDTDPSKQPGAAGASTPEERMGIAIADALQGKRPKVVAAPDDEGGEEEGLPTLADLPDHLATLTTVKDVKALQKTDERVGAVKHYEARIAEIEGE